MAQSVMNEKTAVTLAQQDPDLKMSARKQLTALDWETIQKILIVIKPVYKLTLVGQSENICISQVIPFVKRLKHELATIVAPGIRTFQRSVEEKTIKYFDDKMNIETNRPYTFATLLDPRYKCAGFYSRDKAHAARELLISTVEERNHRGRLARISADSDGRGNETDESVISVMENEDDMEWNQLLRGTVDGPGSPNNLIREEVTRYLKEKLSPQRVDPLEYWRKNNKLYPNVSKLVRVYLCPPPSSVASERAFKVAKNVVGDNRVRLRPENLEMNLFLKYNLRALNYDVKSLESAPADFRYPNSGARDPRDSDEESGDESALGDSEDEDSDIDLEFTDGSEDEDE